MIFALKPKTCRHCKKEFVPFVSTAKACSQICAVEMVNARKAKAARAMKTQERKADREKREKLKSRGDWQREAQTAVNAFVRIRDAHLPCVSCGRMHQGQWHAGHYRSVGSAPHLRFDVERNLHKQCQPCNTHLHGNLVLYRQELIRRIGLDVVESLEADQAPKNYTVDDLKAIKKNYTARARELKKKEQA